MTHEATTKASSTTSASSSSATAAVEDQIDNIEITVEEEAPQVMMRRKKVEKTITSSVTTTSVMSENNRVSLYMVELPSHPPDFIKAVEKLLDDTSEMIEKTHMFESKVNDMTSQIANLNENIVLWTQNHIQSNDKGRYI